MESGLIDKATLHKIHNVRAEDVAKMLKVDVNLGLSDEEHEKRLMFYGNNELKGRTSQSPFKLLLHQLLNWMTIILIFAVAISFASKDYGEGVVISLVVIANTIIGFMQEYKADRTMSALRAMSFPTARVLRKGDQVTISAITLVPGDIMLLKNGDNVGADARILDCQILAADEALLTGETHPVEKSPKTISEENIPVGDQLNMVFASTIITQGKGKTIVVRTGMETELGKIAKSIMSTQNAAEQKTPLQQSLDNMALLLFAISLILAILVFANNGFRYSADISIFAISVAIAVIPEGLTAIVTLTMAMGVHLMAKQRVLIRKLVALEALGNVTNICSDKTGTLTQAKMAVTSAWVPGDGVYDVAAEGLDFSVRDIRKHHSTVVSDNEMTKQDVPEVEITKKSEFPEIEFAKDDDDDIIESPDNTRLVFLGKCALLCNMADLQQASDGQWHGLGDPTEIALQVFAHKLDLGHLKNANNGQYPVWTEHVFDSATKRMSVICHDPDSGSGIVFTKGATERILHRCSAIKVLSEVVDTTGDVLASQVMPIVQKMAQQGKRVISLAVRYLPDIRSKEAARSMSRDDVETKLIFLGLLGITDPPRPESKPSVDMCHAAGISVHMLTGDHPLTAIAIAQKVSILPSENTTDEHQVSLGKVVMTSTEFDALSDAEIDALEELPRVVARCSPDTKVRMIQALHRRKKIVAMTGDGVNDSPSLKLANVGVAMGQSGSDVAKQASDIVLTDDNFASIVNAIAQGRRIFRNIQRFVCVLLGGNVAEGVALIIGLFAFHDLNYSHVFPLSPVQILVNNMITGTPSAIALALEPGKPGTMRQPPRPFGHRLFDAELVIDIIFYGFIMGLLSLLSFVATVLWIRGGDFGRDCARDFNSSCTDLYVGRGVIFATLTTIMLLHTYNCRDLRKPMWNMAQLRRLPENMYIIYAVLFGLCVTIVALYTPVLNKEIFKHSGFGFEWIVVAVASLLFILISDLYKFAKQRWLQPAR